MAACSMHFAVVVPKQMFAPPAALSTTNTTRRDTHAVMINFIERWQKQAPTRAQKWVVDMDVEHIDVHYPAAAVTVHGAL